MTLAVRVFGKRVIFEYGEKKVAELPTSEAELRKIIPVREVKYYVGDGLYGWFNAILFDHVEPFLLFYRNGQRVAEEPRFKTNVFGPTCDSMDCIISDSDI